MKLEQKNIVCPVVGCPEAIGPTGVTKDLVASGMATKPVHAPPRLLPASPAQERQVRALMETLTTFRGEPIKKIRVIHNPVLTESFLQCQKRLNQSGSPSRETLLFHATDRQATGSIIRGGFDLSLSGTSHGEALGPGIYLASEPVYSHKYAQQDAGQSHCMFICRALLGGPKHHRSSQGQHVLRREQQVCPLYIVYY
jgi:hypothetical protein